MSGLLNRGLLLLGMVSALVLAGCSSTLVNHAPVEDRGAPSPSATSSTSASSASASPSTPAPAAKPVPGIENAGKLGYYAVKPGDTLIRIGLESGQSHKDIARWNALENPNRIEVGQILRVVPPTGEAAVVTKPVSSGSVVSTPVTPAPTPSPTSAAASAPAKAASAPAAPATKPASAAVATTGGDDDVAWIWPGKGSVIAEFDDVKNKGVDISGSAGDPVLAAADGKVVYAGAGLRGYGNLIILKHNNTYLSAYAHNQTLLVKEDQAVKKGQKIAEMGSTDSDKVKLHFEVRRQGKPVDPLKYLPAK